MPALDLWGTIRSERESLASDLTPLSDEQWETPSLAKGWTVRDVLAHMTAAARTNPPQFFSRLIGSGFSFDAYQAKGVAANLGATPSATLAGFRAVAPSRTHPPGPNDTWLGEVIVHCEDIRRPLTISHDYPMAALSEVADFYKGSNLIIGSKRRIAGLRLEATDTDWSTGSGPLVRGPMLDLLLAMTGRPVDGLSGDGVETLRSR